MNRHFRASHPEPFRHVIFYSNGRVPRLCPKKHKVAAGKRLHAGGPRAARAIPTPSGNSKSSRKLGYAWLNVPSTSPSGAFVSSAPTEKRTRVRADGSACAQPRPRRPRAHDRVEPDVDRRLHGRGNPVDRQRPVRLRLQVFAIAPACHVCSAAKVSLNVLAGVRSVSAWRCPDLVESIPTAHTAHHERRPWPLVGRLR